MGLEEELAAGAAPAHAGEDLPARKGSLVVVGTGIRAAGQLTTEAVAWIREADRLFYVVSDPVAERVLQRLKPGAAESLLVLYQDGKNRMETYREMIARMAASVYEGHLTVAAFYGHPGVFAYAPHAIIRRLRKEGYEARMLAGISAEDCLFADLGIDPATYGCQSHEATTFVLRRRRPDPGCALVLWQIGIFGNHVYRAGDYDLRGLPLLVDRLREFYPKDHRVCVYEAAIYPGCPHRADWVALDRLAETTLHSASTLFVPPSDLGEIDLDLARQLGIPVPGEIEPGAPGARPIER